MSARVYEATWNPHWRFLVLFKFALDTWYMKMSNGEVQHQYFFVGRYQRTNYPGIRMYGLTLWGLSIRVAINTAKR